MALPNNEMFSTEVSVVNKAPVPVPGEKPSEMDVFLAVLEKNQITLSRNLPADGLKQLLAVDIAGWKKEVEDVAANYARLGSHLPKALNDQLDGLRKRLG